jgi:hypothetical protein
MPDAQARSGSAATRAYNDEWGWLQLAQRPFDPTPALIEMIDLLVTLPPADVERGRLLPGSASAASRAPVTWCRTPPSSRRCQRPAAGPFGVGARLVARRRRLRRNPRKGLHPASNAPLGVTATANPLIPPWTPLPVVGMPARGSGRRSPHARAAAAEKCLTGQQVNRLFTVMNKSWRTDFGPRQSPPSVPTRWLQATRRFLRSSD